MDTSSEKIRQLHSRWSRRKLKKETESLLIAVQNHVIRTNYVKSKIDNVQKNSKWR